MASIELHIFPCAHPYIVRSHVIIPTEFHMVGTAVVGTKEHDPGTILRYEAVPFFTFPLHITIC